MPHRHGKGRNSEELLWPASLEKKQAGELKRDHFQPPAANSNRTVTEVSAPNEGNTSRNYQAGFGAKVFPAAVTSADFLGE